MSCNSGRVGVGYEGDTCSFTCNTGYELTDSDTIRPVRVMEVGVVVKQSVSKACITYMYICMHQIVT